MIIIQNDYNEAEWEAEYKKIDNLCIGNRRKANIAFIRRVEKSAYERGKNERSDELPYETPCKGCGSHPTFWKTVIESLWWDEWEKEQARRFRADTKKGVYDMPEVMECGWISPGHFKEFMEFFIKSAYERGAEEMLEKAREAVKSTI